MKLGEMGIPLEAERGPYGGYRLRPGYKLPPLMLTDAEATAVVLGLLVSRQMGIWMEESAIEEALTKILRVLPAELGERLGALEGSLGLTWRRRRPEPPATEVVLALASAIRRRRRVGIRYATPGREESERTVAPYGLVLHGGRWYLAAHDDRSGEVRTFRVDRVGSAETLAERVAIPDGFDAADHVARSLARLPWGVEVEVVFETTLDEARRRIPRVVGDPEEIEGGVLLRARADDLTVAARMLVSFGWRFTVRGPPELRAALRELAAAIEVAAADPV